MLALHALLDVFRVLIVGLGVAGLIFWRIAIKIIIAGVVILIALGVAAFVLGFAQGMYHVIK
jgi:hypothetical protein